MRLRSRKLSFAAAALAVLVAVAAVAFVAAGVVYTILAQFWP